MEAIEVSQVARLVDLVNVRLLRGELDVVANLVADVAQQLVVDEVLDDGMFVAGGLIRKVPVGKLQLVHTAASLRSIACTRRVPWCRRGRRGSCPEPRYLRWLSFSSPCRWPAPRFCVLPWVTESGERPARDLERLQQDL